MLMLNVTLIVAVEFGVEIETDGEVEIGQAVGRNI